MVVCGKICVDVKPYKYVQVGYDFMAMQYLHVTVHGAEGVSFFVKVFRETVCVGIVSEGFLVLLEPRVAELSPQVASHTGRVTRCRSEGPHDSALSPLSCRNSNNRILWGMISSTRTECNLTQ